jgi:hypothetical protein
MSWFSDLSSAVDVAAALLSAAARLHPNATWLERAGPMVVDGFGALSNTVTLDDPAAGLPEEVARAVTLPPSFIQF